MATTAFKTLEKKYGRFAALRFMRRLGIDFVDAYVAVFGRMPSKV